MLILKQGTAYKIEVYPRNKLIIYNLDTKSSNEILARYFEIDDCELSFLYNGFKYEFVEYRTSCSDAWLLKSVALTGWIYKFIEKKITLKLNEDVIQLLAEIEGCIEFDPQNTVITITDINRGYYEIWCQDCMVKVENFVITDIQEIKDGKAV